MCSILDCSLVLCDTVEGPPTAVSMGWSDEHREDKCLRTFDPQTNSVFLRDQETVWFRLVEEMIGAGRTVRISSSTPLMISVLSQRGKCAWFLTADMIKGQK